MVNYSTRSQYVVHKKYTVPQNCRERAEGDQKLRMLAMLNPEVRMSNRNYSWLHSMRVEREWLWQK